MTFISRTLVEDDVYAVPPGPLPHAVDDSSSENLRIAAIFIVLVAGLLGGIPALFIENLQQIKSLPALLIRSLAVGVILSLAIVHIIPEAFASMDLVVEDYPGESWTKNSSDSPPARPPLASVPDVVKEETMSVENAQASSKQDDASEVSTTQHKIVATVTELGCLFHSVLIGVAVGVTTNRAEVVALVIALVFHQVLEGLALGSMVASAMFPLWKGLLMVLGYSLTAPMGVGIGIGVAAMYNEEDIATAAVQGVMNGISGGMLLYISLVQIMATDFSHTNLAGQGAMLRFCLMFSAVVLGTASMCVIALWL